MTNAKSNPKSKCQMSKNNLTSFLEKNGAGFTFLELIIVFFVVIVGILGVFSFVQYPITASIVSVQRLAATYLAQEGIEIVRNIRDSNWVEGISWNSGLGEGDWEVDYNTQNLSDGYNGDFLKIDSNNFYNYSTGDLTKFKRKITIDAANPNYLKVFVLVEWEEKGKNYPVSVQENLYDWWSD